MKRIIKYVIICFILIALVGTTIAIDKVKDNTIYEKETKDKTINYIETDIGEVIINKDWTKEEIENRINKIILARSKRNKKDISIETDEKIKKEKDNTDKENDGRIVPYENYYVNEKGEDILIK